MNRKNFTSTLSVFVVAAVASVLGACRNEPYCLNCGDGGTPFADAHNLEVAPVDVVRDTQGDVQPDIFVPDGCMVGAPEICNGVDDNCDGRVDEGFDTQTDPANCGMCGHACSLPHAIPACVAGACVVPAGGCDTDFYDLDGNPANGCEYACTPVPGATDDHTCDNRDDNCNGRIDEDVNRCTDVNNCGACGMVCSIPHATPRCVHTGSDPACAPANTTCQVGTCDGGFYDINHDPTDGCEYACVPSGAEVCDGIDNDCNGTIDEGDPGGGGACGSAVGACAQGVNHCMMGHVTCVGGTAPSPEICDGIDNDCNGMVDDGALTADTMVGAPCGSGVGTCQPGHYACAGGVHVCNGGVTPVAEVCDGLDNNCDGMIDNGIAPGGSCGTATGACATGTLQCAGGSMRCMGGIGPTAETCNGIDDDCNGTIDNGFDLQRDPNNCGTCGHVCPALAHAITACQTGTCALLVCQAGFYNLDGNIANGCEYACSFTSATEICNGLDDNCNGATDEGVTAPAGFCRTAGPCAGSTASCSSVGGRPVTWNCNYPASVQVDTTTGQPVSVETLCDGIDNNCNGAIDESFTNRGTSCSNGGIGACGATGIYVCNAAHTATVCNAPAAGTGTQEVCDGADNDCDGSIDETRATPGTNASYVVTPWALISGSGASSVWMMAYEASRPGASSSSPGSLGNRACSATGVLPWTNLTAVQAAAACTAAGARLCTDAEWQTGCQRGAACTWSYSSTCTTYNGATCNGVDHDIDPVTTGIQNGLLPAGSLSTCLDPEATVNPAGTMGLFDMSGNAKEFVSTSTAGSYQLRGGSYNNLAFGTTCTFNWTTVDNTFAFVNSGFRCCYTGATPP